MYEINRTDFQILMAFKINDEDGTSFLDRPTEGITISEIADYFKEVGVDKTRKTIYRHLGRLVETNYLAKGIMSHRADSFYITEKGQRALRGEVETWK